MQCSSASGLAGVNALRAEGEDANGVRDAVDFIAELRQAKDCRRCRSAAASSSSAAA